jgi:hypothetical protein
MRIVFPLLIVVIAAKIGPMAGAGAGRRPPEEYAAS